MRLQKDLKKDYHLLKFRIGRRPMMMDFIEQSLRDPFLYASYPRSYFNFVDTVEPEFVHTLSKNQIA